jgi:hypothetical protein
LRYIILGIDGSERKPVDGYRPLTLSVCKGCVIAEDGGGGSEVRSRYRGEFNSRNPKRIQ